jgi:hypothetical protein
MSKDNDLSGIEFIDDGERMHFAHARMGQDVRMFLTSPVGRYLHGRARLELEEARDVILEANPHTFFGRRKIKKIQRQAESAKLFIRWCTDAITEGDFAEQELENYRGN